MGTSQLSMLLKIQLESLRSVMEEGFYYNFLHLKIFARPFLLTQSMNVSQHLKLLPEVKTLSNTLACAVKSG